MNATGVAPGAVDDASGTAVSMEICRVMAKRSFPATIIFMAVPGEEQGLNGSAHIAKRAKDEKWNVDAMLNNDIVGNTHGQDNDLKDNTHLRVLAKASHQLTRLISVPIALVPAAVTLPLPA
jgi:Zn-dependent M28 family amino/carboxypeptidase